MSSLVKCKSRVQSLFLCLLIPGLLGVVPVGQTDVSGFALAHMGTFSASMLVLLAFQFFANIGLVESFRASALRTMNLFWLISGMILYPASLGLLNRDMYSIGFHSSMSWCVLAASGVAVFLRFRILGMCLAFSVLAHLLVLHESRNLWDYIIDPWLWIAGTVSLVAGASHTLVSNKPPTEFFQGSSNIAAEIRS